MGMAIKAAFRLILARTNEFRRPKNCRPLAGTAARYSRGTSLLISMRAVRLSVVPARLGMVMFGMAGVSVGDVGVMRRLLVIAGLVLLRRFAMVLGRLLVMLSGSLMVLSSLVHGSDSYKFRELTQAA